MAFIKCQYTDDYLLTINRLPAQLETLRFWSEQGVLLFYLRIPDSSSSIHLSVLKLLSKNLTITP